MAIRVLIAKPGLDGHDRGAKVVARALRDAGMEVIYTGIRQTPEMIAETALQEDVQVVGLSILSGAHRELFQLDNYGYSSARDKGIVPPELEEKARLAVANCPERAITLTEETG